MTRAVRVGRPVEFRVDAKGPRPLLTNADRYMPDHQRAEKLAPWRQAVWAAVNEHKLARPKWPNIEIKFWPVYPHSPPDDDGLAPTIKAMIDQFVADRVVPDDNQFHCTSRVEPVTVNGAAVNVLFVVEVWPLAPVAGHARGECLCAPAKGLPRR